MLCTVENCAAILWSQTAESVTLTERNTCSIMKQERMFYKFKDEKRMTFRHFGIILVENNDEEGDSYET